MQAISVRVDDAVKKEAEKVFKVLGLSTATAINIYLNQVAMRKEIPFALTTKNSLDKSGAFEFDIDGKLLEAQEEAKDPKNLIPYEEVKRHWAKMLS